MFLAALNDVAQGVGALWKQILNPATTYGALLYGAVIAIIAWVVGRAIALAFERMMKHPKYVPADRTAIGFLAQLIRLGVYLLAFVMYAQVVPALHHLGAAWLASVGVVSVVLGLAAQNTLGNLIAGISLLLYRPFNIGDRLQVTSPSGMELGVVESLGLGYTVLRTPDNRRVVIPNSVMASQTSINVSLTDKRKMCAIPFRLNDDADVDKARTILIDLVKQHPKALEFVGCPVTALGKSSVTLTLQVWCQDADAAGGLTSDLLESARKQFAKEGVPLHKRRPEKSN